MPACRPRRRRLRRNAVTRRGEGRKSDRDNLRRPGGAACYEIRAAGRTPHAARRRRPPSGGGGSPPPRPAAAPPQRRRRLAPAPPPPPGSHPAPPQRRRPAGGPGHPVPASRPGPLIPVPHLPARLGFPGRWDVRSTDRIPQQEHGRFNALPHAGAAAPHAIPTRRDYASSPAWPRRAQPTHTRRSASARAPLTQRFAPRTGGW